MTPTQLIAYYANLLILQYLQKPKAYATVQAGASQAIMPQTTVQNVTFASAPATGAFNLNYTPFGLNQTTVSASINYNDSASTIQTKLQALAGLGLVTVASLSATVFAVTFTGVVPVVPLLTVSSNTTGVAITVTQTDIVLPLALAGAFNINPALGPVSVGVQLDIIAKYCGVTRTGTLSTGPVTLSDADFLSLIQFAALKNCANSDLGSIQTLIYQFFAGEILVFDYQNMQMSYLISSSIGSQNLARLLVAEGLLFRPMGVSLGATIYAPVITTFFGFRTYLVNTANNTPFNNYASYNTNYPWLSYANAITT